MREDLYGNVFSSFSFKSCIKKDKGNRECGGRVPDSRKIQYLQNL